MILPKVDAVVWRLINFIYHIIFECFEGETGVDLFRVDGQVKLFVRIAEHFAAEKIALSEHARQTCDVAVFACWSAQYLRVYLRDVVEFDEAEVADARQGDDELWLRDVVNTAEDHAAVDVALNEKVSGLLVENFG